MKKKILFVIDSLTIGGAEKSLISILSTIDPDKFQLNLLLFRRGGAFESLLPPHINILPIPDYFYYLFDSNPSIVSSFKYLPLRLKTSFLLRLNNFNKTKLHSEQVVFKSIKKKLANLDQQYDIAIAYSQGMPTYYVASKVHAKKKLAWINTDYVNTLYDKELDYESYQKIDTIIAVSSHIKNSVSRIRNEYKEKVHMIRDIVNPELIQKLANQELVNEFNPEDLNILTVGRIETAKSYDKAVEAAKLLKEHGYNFKWYCIGEGSEKDKLKILVEEYNLERNFIFLGSRMNPYPYMKACDIYVQTSQKEGFGLTVCEAKILKKPIVCTNFPTAHEIIDNEVDGIIVEQNPKEIFSGIKKYLDNRECLNSILSGITKAKTYSSLEDIEKFYELIEC